jgi:cyclopropane fatty-acyl-phospholipid synthase-like methyltransferase
MATEPVEIQWKGRTGPFPLLLGPGVFSPTATSKTLAEAMEIQPGDTVIDVGCGSGVLAFVAAKLGAAKVYGVDLSLRAVDAARENAKRLGLETVCEFRQGDLLEPVRDVQATVLIGDVSGIPDDIAAESGWFDEVPSGGPTGSELPTKFVLSIGDTLAPGGRLYLPTGTIQYEKPILDAAHQVFGDHIQQVIEREFPLPDLVAKSKAVTQMVKDGIVSFRQRGSRWLWQLRIWRCERV